MDEASDEDYLYWPSVPPWRYKLAFSRHPTEGWYVGIVEAGAVVHRRIWQEPPRPVPIPTMRVWLESELVPTEAAYEMVAEFARTHPALFEERS